MPAEQADRSEVVGEARNIGAGQEDLRRQEVKNAPANEAAQQACAIQDACREPRIIRSRALSFNSRVHRVEQKKMADTLVAAHKKSMQELQQRVFNLERDKDVLVEAYQDKQREFELVQKRLESMPEVWFHTPCLWHARACMSVACTYATCHLCLGLDATHAPPARR